ncbi:hypothetical protein [Paenibacillus sp. J2TS4]|uniref:hypothetical protein n=1 Tax=Paenibacillus sp. J2TS4 TaxID=2807194 RepID=UPI001AFD0A67|nr:hypothetical protein [Paenibacillus sp. J2TS4]GIP35783.1 hypothetical protein J2TS4_49930 [Paenibacillus sp. J2TS4]
MQPTDSMNDRLRSALKEMDGLFHGFFEWLEGQYDPEHGAFYYAQSSKASDQFIPDIESTAQALNLLARCQLFGALDDTMKQRMITFFQQKQEPSTGYFYDADPLMREDEVMVARAIGYSLGALWKLGAKPLYPLPNDRQASPDYIRTPDTYVGWLQSVELSNSWRGCDRLCTSAAYLAQMPQADRKPYLDAALRYFEALQDPESGLWGEGSWYVKVSGTFKLHTFYERFRVPIPRVREMYNSLLHCLRKETAVDMCYIRNPIHLLYSMRRSTPLDELLEIIEITVYNMSRLKRKDGGFSRELDHSPPAPNVAQVKPGEFYPDMPKPVRLGLGKVEGDMNAGTQAILIRHLCYELAGIDAPPLSSPPDLFRSYTHAT